MQKCNGYGCTHTQQCLHYREYEKKTNKKGKWIDADKCINSRYKWFTDAK